MYGLKLCRISDVKYWSSCMLAIAQFVATYSNYVQGRLYGIQYRESDFARVWGMCSFAVCTSTESTYPFVQH